MGHGVEDPKNSNISYIFSKKTLVPHSARPKVGVSDPKKTATNPNYKGTASAVPLFKQWRGIIY
jgi:hypothetical protein